MRSESSASNPQKNLSVFPTLSSHERDWRWNRVREMMAKNNIDVLFVLPDPADMLDSYLTNDSPGAAVIFPQEGEPTAIFAMGATWAGAWLMAQERGEDAWVKDWRFHPASVVNVLKERGFANKRIGTLGVSDGTYAAPNGRVSLGLWTALRDSLPNAELVPMMHEFAPIWMTKSEEDLALFRHAAAICEAACEVAVATARPGVNELELYTRVQYEFLRNGAVTPGMILHSGRGNVGHYLPKWLHRAQPRRTIEWGDTIHIEMVANVAGAHGQAQQSIAVGDVDEVHAKAARLAREAYEIGLKTLRPGITFAEVCEAMGEPNRREGAWQLTPLLHSMAPLYCVDLPTKGIEHMTGLADTFKDFYDGQQTGGDVVIQAGMVFQFEPNAAFGRDYVDVGGNIIVTETGCEALNVMPTEMRVVR
jgi:Xaa-Pro aminopeptidase